MLTAILNGLIHTYTQANTVGHLAVYTRSAQTLVARHICAALAVPAGRRPVSSSKCTASTYVDAARRCHVQLRRHRVLWRHDRRCAVIIRRRLRRREVDLRETAAAVLSGRSARWSGSR